MGVIAEEAVRIRADTAGFHQEASSGILGSVTKIAASAGAIFGGIQLGKGLYNATIKSAADFQTTLKVLQATTHASNSDLQRLSATAVKLGGDVHLPATSAKSAADAMLQLGRAGFSTNQTIAATRGVLLLSTAAEVDNATAADMVSKAIGAFGLRAKDAGTVVNDFAGAANASQSSLADVGEAVTQAGAGFHALRIPVSDAATAIAEMAKQGITGGMAGAALNVAFTRLATPTKAAQVVMKDMGVQLFDNNGKFVGLRSAIEQMSPKLAQMTDQQRLHTLSVLGGTRGMKALADVLGVGVGEWDKTHAAVTRAGQAQQIANAKTSGFNGAVLALQNTLGTLALKIGVAVLPKVTELVTWLGRIAAAPNFNVAIRIVWTGIKEFAGNVEKAISDALFGSSSVVHVGGGSPHVEVDPGLVAAIQKAIGDGIAGTDWSGVGSRIGTAISAAIKITTDAMNGMLTSMLAWVNSHTSQIAAVGAVIGLTILSKLLDPAFWAQHWQLIGGLVLSAASFAFPEGKLAVVGEKLAASALSTFGATAGRLITAALELLPGKFGEVTPKLVTAAGSMLAKVVTEMTFYGVRIVDALVTAISGMAGRLSGVVKTLIYTGIVGVVGGAVGAAATAAEGVATSIANGIKTAPAKLAGLAGDLAAKIQAAAGQAAGSAFAYMRQIGFSIADGIISGIGNLGQRLVDAVVGPAIWAKNKAMSLIGAGSPSRLFADTLGAAIGDGVAVGAQEHLATLGDKMGDSLRALTSTMQTKIQPLVDQIASAAPAAAAKLTSSAKSLEAPVAQAFGRWLDSGKKAIDAQFALIQSNLDSNLAAAKAKLDVWKAKLTPTEALLAAQPAHAAEAAVNLAVGAAERALSDLKKKQASDWADLLATQAANMASLKASVQATATTALIAAHELNKDIATSGSDPLATNLLAAHQSLDNIMALFNQGQATQAQLLAAQDEYDAALLAATNDTNAQKIEADYNTWQGLAAQQAAGSASIAAQQASDQAAQVALQQQQGADRIAASDAYQQSLQAQRTYYEGVQAAGERKARDAAAAELNEALVARYNRIKTHLDNVIKATDSNFDQLGRMATKSGGDIGANLAKAMRDAIPAVSSAAAALAQTVSRYLKTNSPTELGPMSDLDKWWGALAPTLVASLDHGVIKAALTNAATVNGGVVTGGRGAPAAIGGAAVPATVRLDEDVSGDLRDLVRILKKQSGSTSSTTPSGDTNVYVVPAGVDAQVYRSRR